MSYEDSDQLEGGQPDGEPGESGEMGSPGGEGFSPAGGGDALRSYRDNYVEDDEGEY